MKNTVCSSVLLGFVVCVLVGVAPGSAAADETAISGPAERTLPSGAKALLWPRPGSGTVLITVAVPAGSQDEPEGMGGLSHYLEHLLFDGFDDLDERDVTEAFERLSAYMNAFTREQTTVYFALVPREAAREAAELMVGMLTRSTIKAPVYDKEKKVILEELAKDHASPNGLREELLRSTLWLETPLEHPVGGSQTSVAATDRDSVFAYWRDHYPPDGFRILVTGDLPLDRLAEVLAPFAALPSRTVPAARSDQLEWPGWGEWGAAEAPEAPEKKGGMPKMAMPSGHGMPGAGSGPKGGTLALVIAAPDQPASSGTALEVVTRWLAAADGPLASVLVPGLAAELSVVRMPREPRDLLEIRVEASVGVDPQELLATTLGALDAAASGPDDASAEVVQRTWAGERALSDQRLHYAAVFFGEALAAARGSLSESVAPPVIAAIDLRNTAGHLLNASRSRTRAAWVGGGGPTDRQPLPDAVAARSGSAPTAFVPGPLGSRVATLENGTVVGVLPEVGSPVFGLHLLVADRTLREPELNPGVSDLVHRLLPGGTVLGGSRALASRMERAGFEVKTADSPAIPFDNRYHVPDFSYVRIEGPASNLELALALLAEMVRVPSWDEHGWRAAVSGHQAARSADNRGSEKAGQLFLQTILGPEHPLSRPASGPLDAPPADADAVKAAWGSWPGGYFSPDRLIVTVASPLTVEQTVELVEDAFSGGTPAAPKRGPYPEPQPASEDLAVEVGEAPQVTVLWGRVADVDVDDRAALLVTMDALSDRMTAIIREREGMAYRLGASVRPLPGGSWVLSARVGTRPENSERVAELLEELVNGLRRQPLSESDLERLNARRRRTRMLRSLSAASRAYRVGRALFEGPGSPLAVDESAFGGVSPDDVVAAAKKYLVPEEMLLVVTP